MFNLQQMSEKYISIVVIISDNKVNDFHPDFKTIQTQHLWLR